MTFRVELNKIDNIKDVEPVWTSLQSRLPSCSFFQSWSWIGCWLSHVVNDLEVYIAGVYEDSDPVALGIIVPRDIRRRLIIRSKAAFLNEAPFDGRNMTIEYNGLLVEADKHELSYRLILDYLHNSKPGFDEVFLGALSEAHTISDRCVEQYEESIAWSRKLDSRTESWDALLSSLSKNRRSQLRRSKAAFEERGDITIEEARDIEQAKCFFETLKRLHTERWEHVGKAGAFANQLWETFHQSLIETRFGSGEIQLLEVKVADETIGVLYNFLWRGRVYILLTGFARYYDKRLMPGYISHIYAMLYNYKKGFKIYDLMHGDSIYKQVLCERRETLRWYVSQKDKWQFGLERTAVSLVRKLRSGSSA